MGATFVDSLDSLSRKDKSDSFLEFRNINTFLLEVGVFADHACWVELGSTSTVRVSSTDS